jgi:hypothetical protein
MGLARIDQGVAAHQAVAQVQVDVRAGLDGGERGGRRHRAQFDTDDTRGFVAHLEDERLQSFCDHGLHDVQAAIDHQRGAGDE